MFFVLGNWKARIEVTLILSVQFQAGISNINIKCWGLKELVSKIQL